jgi:hypothetical protein
LPGSPNWQCALAVKGDGGEGRNCPDCEAASESGPQPGGWNGPEELESPDPGGRADALRAPPQGLYSRAQGNHPRE